MYVRVKKDKQSLVSKGSKVNKQSVGIYIKYYLKPDTLLTLVTLLLLFGYLVTPDWDQQQQRDRALPQFFFQNVMACYYHAMVVHYKHSYQNNKLHDVPIHQLLGRDEEKKQLA